MPRIIVAALPYPAGNTTGPVAAYALGDDYHDGIPQRLRELIAWLELEAGRPIAHKVYTDSGPLLERDLAQRAKSGALKPEEYTGGTFTISNLGPYDVETLIAIIQPPQTAILGVGSVREAAVVRDGQVVAGQLMKAALSADHRVTDGAQGAQFLNEIRRLLENPIALLV